VKRLHPEIKNARMMPFSDEKTIQWMVFLIIPEYLKEKLDFDDGNQSPL
jgi:hypothetical protein